MYNDDQLNGALMLLPQGIVGWDYLVSFCKSKVKCIPFLKKIRKETLEHLYFTPFEEFIAFLRKKNACWATSCKQPIHQPSNAAIQKHYPPFAHISHTDLLANRVVTSI